MKQSKKILLITALVCIAAGLLVIASAALSVGFDFSKMSTVQYERKLTPITDEFDSIVVGTLDNDIVITTVDTPIPQAAEWNITVPTVVSHDADGIVTDIDIRDGTLYINRRDERRWYQKIGISFGNEDLGMTVFLPDKEYDRMHIETYSGDVRILPRYSLRAASMSVESLSGDLEAAMVGADHLNIVSTSGNVTVRNSTTYVLDMKTTSGEVEVQNTAVLYTLNAETTSGDIDLEHVATNARAVLKTVSGDVEFMDFDAFEIDIHTTSGDVEGSVSSGKKYHIDTTSGEVHVPSDDAAGGMFSIRTVSGDIEIENE